jgi:hypothetical protein
LPQLTGFRRAAAKESRDHPSGNQDLGRDRVAQAFKVCGRVCPVCEPVKRTVIFVNA